MRRILVLFVLANIASAAAQEPAKPATPLPPELASMFGYGDSNKTCLAWTDGCGTCSRADNGDPLCPNIGIACQPTPIRCVRSSDAQNPPAGDDKKPEPPK